MKNTKFYLKILNAMSKVNKWDRFFEIEGLNQLLKKERLIIN